METKMIRKGDVINTQVIPPKLHEWLMRQDLVHQHRDLYLYLMLTYIDLYLRKAHQEDLDECILSYCDEFTEPEVYLSRMKGEIGQYIAEHLHEEKSQLIEILRAYQTEPLSKTVLCWLYPTDLFFIVWLGAVDAQAPETHD